MARHPVAAMCLAFAAASLAAQPPASDPRAAKLAEEVRGKGWIVFSARSPKGDWDLFLMRPDGSQRRNLTNTPGSGEGGARFSPDGTRLLYRRFPRDETISHDKWGFQGELVIANADGTSPAVQAAARELPWASWGPDGQRIACLGVKGIDIVDLATKKTTRSLNRKGIYQQLTWSPDGKWLCGTANYLGETWTVARMSLATGELNAVSKFQNCTPDWFPDSQHLIFSYRPAGQGGYGWTQLWRADAEGTQRGLVYGEDGRHVYGGAVSPDGKYVLFTRCAQDGGGSERSGAPMALMRLADAPTLGGASQALRTLHPQAKDGPVLPLPDGWEPHWTYADVGATR